MHYKPDGLGSYFVQCTRGTSSMIWHVWAQARSRKEAEQVVRDHVYLPIK